MCGIAGKILFTDDAVKTVDINRMVESIRHRGPDDHGVFISDNRNVALGHARLSIIDTSSLGHQPMQYKNRYVISFNGEIYNFQEKRELLKTLGHKFTSHTDTEVILALYDEYGPDCLQHLRGMFAFAIYDKQKQTLFCARDRVGKKPFKYVFTPHLFLFASELKALLTQPEYSKALDYEAIHDYLTFQYVPGPRTGFQGIQKLLPGHYLLLDCKTAKLDIIRYWQLNVSTSWELSEKEWCARINNQLEEAVRLRLISDVPLGAFLSGGIDSSAIVGHMSRLVSDPVKTFSIGFKENTHNELPFARQVANYFKTDHHEFIVKPDMIHDLSLLIRSYEEPFADVSALPTYHLSKLARQYVTVALTGDGGDENFAGYSRYQLQKIMLLYTKYAPKYIQRFLPSTKKLLRTIPMTFFDRLALLAGTSHESYDHRYVNYISFFSNHAKQSLYNQNFKKLLAIDSYQKVIAYFKEVPNADKLTQTTYADFNTYLPDDLLVKMDIASMANSLEARSPLLDHAFLELTAHIPIQLKLKGLHNSKYIFKQALHGFLPETVLNRPKMGFGVPLDTWFRTTLKSYIQEKLTSKQSRLSEMFDPNSIKNILHIQKDVNMGHQLWMLLNLELWLEEFF